MTKSINALLTISFIFIAYSTIYAQNEHIGLWKGNDQGQVGYINFDTLGSAYFIIDGDTLGGESYTVDEIELYMKYEMNYTKPFNTLDFIFYLKDNDTEFLRMPAIFKFNEQDRLILCINFETEERPKSFKDGDSVQLEKVNLEVTEQYVDTTFIQRELNEHFYHAIYIDTSRESAFYDRLTNFEFSSYDLKAYQGNYKYLKENYSVPTKNLNITDLPENWIPVYEYNKEYYLYAPSDWGSAGRRIINDSAFVYWYMDGPLPVALSDFKKKDNNTYVLELTALFNEKISKQTLNIYQIDPERNLYLFEFSDKSGNQSHQLYVPAESAKHFDMIVNYCKNRKQREFRFDEIDFEKILEENR